MMITIQRCAGIVVASVMVFAATALAQAPEVIWMNGPGTVDVGEDLAEIRLGAGHAFADGDDTRRVMAAMGNPETSLEVGMVVPTSEDASWFIVFEYFDVGHIRDDEKDEIDADALLESIRRGTEEGNKQRVQMGFSPLHILGWHEKPHYDEATHNLVWAILGESDGDSVVNYNTRILGREGYMSTVVVTGPQELEAVRGDVETVMSTFSYKDGRRYAEFREGDRMAKYGLAALIAGGAGAAAAKTGLLAAFGKVLAKLGKALVFVVIAVLAFFRKIIASVVRGIRGPGASRTRMPGRP